MKASRLPILKETVNDVESFRNILDITNDELPIGEKISGNETIDDASGLPSLS